jgi:hypothetical protein
MKNRAGTDVVLIVLASLAAFAATGLAQGKPGKVEIKNDFIVVHPGTKLSRADAQALNDVLKKYDKALYKIQIYKNGKVTKTLGTLNDMYIDQKAVADLAQAKTSGQSERAIQLIAPPAKMAPVNPQTGSAVNPQTGSPAPSGPQMPSSPVPSGPQAPSSPVPSGPQAPSSPVPSGPQAPTSPVPSGPQAPGSPVPSGPQAPGSPVPSGPQKSASSPVNPQTSSTTNTQQTEFLKRLKPILEKYSQ